MWLIPLPMQYRKNWIHKEWWILYEVQSFQNRLIQRRPLSDQQCQSTMNLWCFGDSSISVIRDWWWWMIQLFTAYYGWLPQPSTLVLENNNRVKRGRVRHSVTIVRAIMLQTLESLEFLQELNVLTTKQGLQEQTVTIN